jgi:response regulator of citrate/malate metabolism
MKETMMRVLLASTDERLISQVASAKKIAGDNLKIYKDEAVTALDIMSMVCSTNPGLLILDDDFIKPESYHLLKSIRKVNKNIRIIFITSDDSISLGRSIMPLDILYYGMKPLKENELQDALNSVIQTSHHF